MFIINKVIKEKNNTTIVSTNEISYNMEKAQEKLHNTIKDIVNEYGVCKDTRYLKDSIQFNYENNRMIHIFINQIILPNPRVIIELDKGVIKNISSTNDIELIVLDYYRDTEKKKGNE